MSPFTLAAGLGDSFDWASYLMEGIEFPTFSDDESEEVCAVMIALMLRWCVLTIQGICGCPFLFKDCDPS